MTSLTLVLLSLPLSAQTVTFSKDIAPLVFEHCAACHRPGEAGPFPLLTYDDVRKHAAQIVSVTQRRYMPPWLPEPGHGDFTGLGRLSAGQIALFARWVKDGTPLGDPWQVPKPPAFTDGWQLGPPDLVLHMRQPYQLTAEPGDVFRNFVLPVSLTQTRYIRAMELRPGNKRVVHHANLIVDHARQLRKRDGEDGHPGFAGMEVITEAAGEFDPDSHFLFWKPGSTPMVAPDDMAWKLEPGADLIVNLHLQPSGKPETIDAVVGLYFAKQPPRRFPMLLQLEHDGAIDIPPGAARFTVTDHLTLPVAVDLLAVYPHAHYLGKEIESWAELPGGERRPLLLIQDWDINWQAIYTYRKPVSLPAGATLAMRIVYDNSAANPRNPSHPPRRVVSGNRSADEMGHVWFQVLPAASGGGDPRLVLEEAAMHRRIEKYPADFVAYFNLGAALQSAGKHEEALAPLARAVQLSPTNAAAHNNLAVSLIEMERNDDATRELRAALAADPNYQNARYNLARVLQSQGDSSGALNELLTYLQSSPDDGQAQGLAGRALASLGRFADSLPYFRKAIELEPENSAMETNLGAALAMTGNLREAIATFERALAADPTNQAARDNLARARAMLQGRQ
ncbi:MAG TPA: tetratricopeptide repeat protein [Bryobacteraceae bacterium]|nr:tetratricopeptide repeat protein [Bryobacteraceae bacterium]